MLARWVALKYNLKPWTESTDIYYKRNLYFLFRYKNKTFLSKFGFLVKPIIKQLVFLKLNWFVNKPSFEKAFPSNWGFLSRQLWKNVVFQGKNWFINKPLKTSSFTLESCTCLFDLYIPRQDKVLEKLFSLQFYAISYF